MRWCANGAISRACFPCTSPFIAVSSEFSLHFLSTKASMPWGIWSTDCQALTTATAQQARPCLMTPLLPFAALCMKSSLKTWRMPRPYETQAALRNWLAYLRVKETSMFCKSPCTFLTSPVVITSTWMCLPSLCNRKLNPLVTSEITWPVWRVTRQCQYQKSPYALVYFWCSISSAGSALLGHFEEE